MGKFVPAFFAGQIGFLLLAFIACGWVDRKMFRTDINKGQLFAASTGLLFLAAVAVVPPCNDVCSFATQDNLKTYRSAGFRPWWQIGKQDFQQAEANEYLEINWSLWLVELGAALALASSAVVVSGRQN